MGRRTILLIASVLVAAVGTALVFLYVQGADQRAAEGQAQVQVLFAKGDIGAGTTVNEAAVDDLFETKTVTQDSAPDTALSSTDELAPTDKAVSLIVTGQPIVEGNFSSSGATEALSIPEGKLAVQVQLPDPARVAGLLQPSDEVKIFVTIPDPRTQQEITQVLLDKVQVLRVGSQTPVPAATANPSAEQVPLTILTLALDTAEAQKVIYAQSKGQLWFGLRSPTTVDEAVPATNGQNLFGGQ